MRSSPFPNGYTISVNGGYTSTHTGYDLRAKRADGSFWPDAPCYPIFSGKVWFAYKWKGGLGGNENGGNFSIISNNNGLLYYVGHMRNLFVKTGQTVTENTVLGQQGNTGYVVGAGDRIHAHCELRAGTTFSGGKPIDLLQYIRKVNKDMDTIDAFKISFITVNQRWPSSSEVRSFKKSNKLPYQYVQEKYLSKAIANGCRDISKRVELQRKKINKAINILK